MKNSPVAAKGTCWPEGSWERNSRTSSGSSVPALRIALGPLKWHITHEMLHTSVVVTPPTWTVMSGSAYHAPALNCQARPDGRIRPPTVPLVTPHLIGPAHGQA